MTKSKVWIIKVLVTAYVDKKEVATVKRMVVRKALNKNHLIVQMIRHWVNFRKRDWQQYLPVQNVIQGQ